MNEQDKKETIYYLLEMYINGRATAYQIANDFPNELVNMVVSTKEFHKEQLTEIKMLKKHLTNNSKANFRKRRYLRNLRTRFERERENITSLLFGATVRVVPKGESIEDKIKA